MAPDQEQPAGEWVMVPRALLGDARWRIANLVGPAGATGHDREVLDRIDETLAASPAPTPAEQGVNPEWSKERIEAAAFSLVMRYAAHPLEQRQAALREALTRYGFTKNQQFDIDRALVEASATPAQATQPDKRACSWTGGACTRRGCKNRNQCDANTNAEKLRAQAKQTAEPDASAQGIER